jgi:hypothetical protein
MEAKNPAYFADACKKINFKFPKFDSTLWGAWKTGFYTASLNFTLHSGIL